MTKEIIVNAGELESRVAVLENGRLMELHVERDPKIVGNIYKGRVTKVLKGMDAAFVDIGIERNAFLSVSDVVPQEDEEGGHGHGNGRISRANLPPITQLLHAGQEILVQVVRAPMGTKGARITTRLSLPGRYMVLMLNSGTYIGVSRKIEDSKERHRLRDIAERLRVENYSLIVRTEAEGKSEEELEQDMHFLVDMARRIEQKSNVSSAPALVHGDLTLIYRIIRDAFTRDVNRLVVDSPASYENVLELVGMIAPRLRNRVFLYDEVMPIFHAYNIEPEIERMLRRKVWLPSGGSLVIDQGEALTAIDVNTGRFVGSTELAETVLTTNLQAADEVARQLRLRDLGGIIVVDFIDMDNPRHRQQVTKAFEEALRRDRAKIKVHSISPLGLVEMTRKRTGESLANLLTEPCPYCSGIGRVQNPLSMALRVERELAASSVEHPEAEALLVTAHPRVVASMLGYEGEAHRDLEEYIGRPAYLRIEEDYHPNTYRLERLTLEQALAAVPHLEEGELIEGVVVNPDPELSLSPLVQAKGIYLVVPDLDAPVGARVKVRVTDVDTSMAFAEPLAEEQRGIRAEEAALPLQRPPLVPEFVLPAYLREERRPMPPRGLPLLSPTAEAVPELAEAEEEVPVTAVAESASDRRHRKSRRKKRTEAPAVEEAAPAESYIISAVEAPVAAGVTPVEPAEEEETAEAVEGAGTALSRSARRRRRRRSRRTATTVEQGEAAAALPEEADVVLEELAHAAEGPAETEPVVQLETGAPIDEVAMPAAPEEAPKTSRRRRRSNRRRERPATEVPSETAMPEEPAAVMPVIEEIDPASAEEALRNMLNAIPEPGAEEAQPETVEAETEAEPTETALLPEEAVAEPVTEVAPVEPAPEEKPRRTPRRRTTRRPKAAEEPSAEAAPVEPAPEAVTPAEEAAATPEAPAEEQPAPPTRRRRTTTTRRRKAEAETPSPTEETPPPAEPPTEE